MKRLVPIAVPLLLTFYAVPWVLYLRGRPGAETVRVVRSEAPTTPAPEAPAPKPDAAPKSEALRQAGEHLTADPLDLQGLALKLAAIEAEKVRGYEAALASMAERLPLAESYKVAGRWADLADLAEAVIKSRPVIALTLLDPSWLRHRSNLLCCRFGILLREAQLTLIDGSPVASAEEKQIRDGLRIKWMNEAREFQRQLEEWGTRREPAPRAARTADGHDGPPAEVDTAGIQRDRVATLLQAMRVNVDFSARPLEELLAYLREMSGLNITIRGVDARVTPVTVTLRDVTMEVVLEHLGASAGLTWDVDRFGILTLSPRK